MAINKSRRWRRAKAMAKISNRHVALGRNLWRRSNHGEMKIAAARKLAAYGGSKPGGCLSLAAGVAHRRAAMASINRAYGGMA
jgi:hypothetical protein